MKLRSRIRSSHAGLAAVAAVAAALSPVATAQEIDEIVVSARKRTETLQTVPVSVTAVASDTIVNLNLQDFADISKLSAGLIFDNDFGRTSDRPVIRGQANILGESGVSYFIDGVYIEGSLADFDLNDVERFEIIKELELEVTDECGPDYIQWWLEQGTKEGEERVYKRDGKWLHKVWFLEAWRG